MKSDPVIEFAQRRFGTDVGIPASTTRRTPLPGLAEVIVTETGVPGGEEPVNNNDWPANNMGVAESIVLSEGDDPIRVEGDVAGGHDPGPVGDGTTPDALAYYLPFHFYPAAWGIYVRASGVWALARRFSLPRVQPAPRALEYAYKLLKEHECLHFSAEYAASRIEVVTANACYASYFSSEDAGLHEEALANAHAVRRLTRGFAVTFVGAANDWMNKQGPGYSDFDQWLSPSSFVDGQRRAAAFMTETAATENLLNVGALSASNPLSDLHPADFLFRNTAVSHVPVYIVFDLAIPWLRVAKPFPKGFGVQVFVYTNDHKPPHVHIECPPGTPRTRYQWPSLSPLRGDPRLKAGEEGGLRKYLSVHGKSISAKVGAIPWK